MKTIRSSNGRYFHLTATEMVETKGSAPNRPRKAKGLYFNKYKLVRSDLRAALKNNIEVGYTIVDGAGFIHTAPISERSSQRGKKAINIGCMRFVGENRAALLRWAKAGK